MAPISPSVPKFLGPLVGWAVVHILAAAGMFNHTNGTPLVAGDMDYRWLFAAVYVFAGLIPVVSYWRNRQSLIPATTAQEMAIAFGLYVFLIGTQVGQLPVDDVRLLTGAFAAIGGGACLIVFNRRLQRARKSQARIDEDELIGRITEAIRTELQAGPRSLPEAARRPAPFGGEDRSFTSS